jgi:hypothetical protein
MLGTQWEHNDNLMGTQLEQQEANNLTLPPREKQATIIILKKSSYKKIDLFIIIIT